MDNIWIFGASKPLGRTLTEALSVDYDVTTFGRAAEENNSGLSTHIEIDLADSVTLRMLIEDQFKKNSPAGIIFCQRYRSESNTDDLSFLTAAIDVELAPLLMVRDAIRKYAVSDISIVAFSSVAARLTNVDVPLGYHLLKALMVATVSHLAALDSDIGTRVNCILLGDYLKYPRGSYTGIERAKFAEVESISLKHRLCGLSDITSVTRFLLSRNSEYLSGQVIELDGTAANKSSASILRSKVYD